MTHRIAPCRSEEVPQLTALAQETFCDTFGHLYSAEDLSHYLENDISEAAFVRLLAEPGVHNLIVWEGDIAIAYMVWGTLKLHAPDAAADAMELYKLYVRTSHQRLGLGKQMLERFIAETADASECYLSVWENNEKAQALYGKYGFKPSGEHRFMVGNQADRDLIWCMKNPVV